MPETEPTKEEPEPMILLRHTGPEIGDYGDLKVPPGMIPNYCSHPSEAKMANRYAAKPLSNSLLSKDEAWVEMVLALGPASAPEPRN